MDAEGLLFSKFLPPVESEKSSVEASSDDSGSDTDQNPEEDGSVECGQNLTDALTGDESDTAHAQAMYETPSPASSTPATPTPTNALESAIRSEECISPMLTDPNLPPGWTRKVTQRTMGASAGKYDVYIFSPDGKKIRSKTDLMLYLVKNNLDLDPNSIDFSVRGRANIPAKRPSKPRPPRSKKPKLEKSKLATDVGTKARKPTKTRKPNKSVTNGSSSSQAIGPHNSASKLVVKFNFPIARIKRSASLKIKRNRRKISRQDSQTSQMSETRESQTSDNSYTSGHPAQFECQEELSNGEARLTNGFDFGQENEAYEES
ncbi:methyl-CpG-binding protein 2-like [Watersipora subatra]|uniref:methyl-CpG-binding protein 2-like n=1 Tax=Watersipora subatra TaxID=2589382 RepID=UPI00355BC319